MKRSIRVLSSLVLLSCGIHLGACRTIEGTYGVPPFYEVYDTPSSIDARVGKEVYVRPLFSYEKWGRGDGKIDRTRVRSIFPSPLPHLS